MEIQVNSSNLKAVEFVSIGNKQTGKVFTKLIVTFNGGRRYQYDGVPADLYNELLDSDSKGRFFNANIRDDYSFTEL